MRTLKYGPCCFRIAKPSTRNTTAIHRHAMGSPVSEPYFHDNQCIDKCSLKAQNKGQGRTYLKKRWSTPKTYITAELGKGGFFKPGWGAEI
jgi:hypothetical protein